MRKYIAGIDQFIDQPEQSCKIMDFILIYMRAAWVTSLKNWLMIDENAKKNLTFR